MTLSFLKPEPVDTTMLTDEGYWDPKKVTSPKTSVKGLNVIFEGKAGTIAVAILDYVFSDGTRDPKAVAIRWNGTETDRLGFPSVRQYPVWFIVPDELASSVKFLAESGFQFKLPFEQANAERYMSFFGKQFSTDTLTKELAARGYKVILEK